MAAGALGLAPRQRSASMVLRALKLCAGVPISILYDNTTVAVAKIGGEAKRERTQAFTRLCSHYLFQDRFGRNGKGNEKRKVEGLVKFSRSNFMVPIPVYQVGKPSLRLARAFASGAELRMYG